MLAFIWGLAEATLFFIVVDVLLSLLVLKNRRHACIAGGYAVAGAILGGWLMYFWATQNIAQVRSVLSIIPAISPDVLVQVRQQLNEWGYASLFIGALSGVPYKIYAVEASAQTLSLMSLLIVTIPARALRYMLVILLVDRVSKCWMKGWTYNKQLLVVVVCWVVFYLWYFFAP